MDYERLNLLSDAWKEKKFKEHFNCSEAVQKQVQLNSILIHLPRIPFNLWMCNAA